jgi:hypothetical protein
VHSEVDMVPEDPVQGNEWGGDSLTLHFYNQEAEDTDSDDQRVAECQVE